MFDFLKNYEFDKKVKLIEMLFLIFGVIVVFIQLRESNRLTWLQTIEIRSNDLIKIQIDNNNLQCLYKFKNKQINDNCKSLFNDIKENRKAIIYLDELLDLYIEVINYDDEYSIKFISKENEFNEYYKKWYLQIFKNDLVFNHFIEDIDKDKISFIEEYIKVSINN